MAFNVDIKENCNSCSKENYRIVPTMRIQEKLSELFSRNDLASVGKLLAYWDGEARTLGDERGLLEILNEEIGYFRRTSEKDKAMAAVTEAFALLEKTGICDTISAGTIYLNGATTMKAFGETEQAMQYYGKANTIYHENLAPDDYRLAAFYNNVSAAYKELGDDELAEKMCNDALKILKDKEDCLGEMAVTLINIAHIYYDRDPLDERIYEIVDKAWSYLMNKRNQRDGDFAFICDKCHPSFAFFGYFEREAELKAIAKRIYEGA